MVNGMIYVLGGESRGTPSALFDMNQRMVVDRSRRASQPAITSPDHVLALPPHVDRISPTLHIILTRQKGYLMRMPGRSWIPPEWRSR